MTLTREVSLQTLAVLDQAETGIERLMGSGQPDQVAVAIRYLLRLLTSSSSRGRCGWHWISRTPMNNCLQGIRIHHGALIRAGSLAR